MGEANESFLRKARSAGLRLFRLRSIKGKIFIIFAAAFLSMTVLTALNFRNLSMLKTRMLLSEGYDDLLNNILEVRRFEKNYLIYRDNRSLAESKEYQQAANGDFIGWTAS